MTEGCPVRTPGSLLSSCGAVTGEQKSCRCYRPGERQRGAEGPAASRAPTGLALNVPAGRAGGEGGKKKVGTLGFA